DPDLGLELGRQTHKLAGGAHVEPIGVDDLGAAACHARSIPRVSASRARIRVEAAHTLANDAWFSAASMMAVQRRIRKFELHRDNLHHLTSPHLTSPHLDSFPAAEGAGWNRNSTIEKSSWYSSVPPSRAVCWISRSIIASGSPGSGPRPMKS